MHWWQLTGLPPTICFSRQPRLTQRLTAASGKLLDHLVGCGEERLRDANAERLRGCAIDGEVENGGLLDREIGWFRPFEYLIDVGSGPAIQAHAPQQISSFATVTQRTAENLARRQRSRTPLVLNQYCNKSS